MRPRLITFGGLALAFGALVAKTFSTEAELDYAKQVKPAMNALLDGHVGEFFRVQPVYGAFSVLLRLPFAALARLADGGDLLVYKFGVLPCLVALALVGFLLINWMRDRGQSPGVQLLAGALLLVNPVTAAAIERGHPEELLTAALVLGATFSAIGSRPTRAAVLLGLAIGTKQWALLAVIPVLLACEPTRRLRVGLIATALAAALIVPMAVVDSGRFVENARATTAQGGWAHASRLSVWWPLGKPQKLDVGGPQGRAFTLRRLPTGLTRLARPLLVVLAAALSLAFWRRRGSLVAEDTLGLLALLFLLRCLLDPLDNDYYHVPFLLSLIAWEGLRVRGLPVLSVLATAGLWATISSPWLSPLALGEQFYLVNNVFYLCWTLPLAGWLAFNLFWRTGGVGAAGRASAGEPASGLTRAWIRTRVSSAH
jgi:glycosyl transferase family 87